MDQIIEYSNDYLKVLGIIARLLRAKGTNRDQIKIDPDIHYLAWAKKLLFIAILKNVNPVVKSRTTLVGLALVWIEGCWCTCGRLRKGLFKVLGVDRLPILLPES